MAFRPIQIARRVVIDEAPLRYGVYGREGKCSRLQFRVSASLYAKVKPAPVKFWRRDIDTKERRGLLRALLQNDGAQATRGSRPSNDEEGNFTRVLEWQHADEIADLFPRPDGSAELLNPTVTTLGIEFDLPKKGAR